MRLARLALVAGSALALVRCSESGRYGTGPGTGGGGGGGGGGGNQTPGVSCTTGCPSVTILQPSTPAFPVGVGDSVLVQFRATDDRAIVSVEIVGVSFRGNPAFGTDTVVERFTKRTIAIPNRPDTTMARFLYVIKTDSTTEDATIIVTAIDSVGNRGADTTSVRLSAGPKITISKPNNGATTSVGKSFTIELTAADPQGVRVVGWRATGVVTAADSTIRSGATLPDTVVFIDTLTVPAGTANGNIIITGFAVDSTGDPSSTANGVTVTVAPVGSDVTPPLVTFTVNPRVEVDDSLTIVATDGSGLTRVGFVVRQVGSNTVVAADSQNFSGNLTDITLRLPLRVDTITTFPRLVTVEAFAIDSIGNRGLSSTTTTPIGSTGTAAKDTITVVAGRTFTLPAGGSVGDAIYNRNRNELYLSNLLLNRVEVFNVGTQAFVAGGIPVGSKPLGLALWPRDTLGAYGDTVVVANSGGTNLSIVNVATRREVRRHRLPNYLVQTVKTVLDPSTGRLRANIIEYDMSDRPAYIGTACRTNCAQVYAIYSTTPTGAEPSPMTDRGYLAWEQLNAAPGAPDGHFFYEHAQTSPALSTDTLQIIAVRDSIPGVPVQTMQLGAGAGVMVQLSAVPFQDSTYVRNSGDFNHALLGEGGGDVTFARALTWDARSGVSAITPPQPLCDSLLGPAVCVGTRDDGISPGVFVRDFIGNRASRVKSVATNFNGLTNFVRADSVYVFDLTLRLTGILQVAGKNSGMDVHPNNRFDARSCGSPFCGGTGSPNNRLTYTARPDANIEVFDSYWYGSVAIVPVRDEIIGPIRLALNAGGQQVLVGVTAQGVVVVPLTTAIINPFPITNQLQTTQPARRTGRRVR